MKIERITLEEKRRFHAFLDLAIDKLNSLKNSKKPHWSKHSIGELHKMIEIETAELDHAINYNGDIESECYDIMTLCLFTLDNVL